MPPDELFTRDEALGGLPARRAATLLFLIESRAAHLADQSRRAGDFLASEDTLRERDLAFVEAFSAGREPPVKPTIRDLERHAGRWAPMVPATPAVRAAVAHLLGRKYAFTRRAVPGIRAALGLDGDAVRQAYRRQYRADLDAVFAAQVRPADWLPWAWAFLSARVDSLSPFWLTFGLTIAFSFSQAFLALPTGIARMGALPGVVLVVAIGCVNVLTMACMAEACARSGDFRYGRAFVGRLVVDNLGAEASALFSATTAIRTFLVLLAGSFGIGFTLATLTGIRAELWLVVLAAVELYYLWRGSARVTIATMLSLISLNVLLLLLIAGLAFARLELANLLHMRVPLLAGEPFEPALLRLVFGVVAMLYIGHVYVIQCARIVLPRDPSARSLIQGSVAGTAALTAVFVVWVLAVNGAVDAERLASEAGTALTPLAERIGPAIRLLGAALVVVLLGMSCLRTATVLFNLVHERVPARLTSIVTLPRRSASLRFEPRGPSADVPRVEVTYLGLAEGRPRLLVHTARSGVVERTEVVAPRTWDLSAVLGSGPGRRAPSAALSLEVIEASSDAVSVRVTTTMSVSVGGEWLGAGLELAGAMALDDSRRGLLNWMARRGEVGLDEVAAYRGTGPDGARALLDDLAASGVVEPLGPAAGDRYRVRLAARRARRVPAEIWRALDVPAGPVGRPRPAGRFALSARGLVASEGGRFLVAASPVLLVLAVGEWLLLAGAASFAAVLGFGGVVANSLTAGIFPVLLLVASRRKGDYVPGVVYRALGHPVFVTGVYLLSLVNLFLHGLAIYRDPLARGTALLFGVAVIGVTAVMVGRGAFHRRTVVELREDLREGTRSVLAITSGGQPMAADVRLGRKDVEEDCRSAAAVVADVSALQYAAVHLPPGPAREVKVWAHRVTADGASEGLAAHVEVRCGADTSRFDLRLSRGQAIFPVSGGECWVRILLREGERPAD